MDRLKWCLQRGPEETSAQLDNASEIIAWAVHGIDDNRTMELLLLVLASIHALRDHVLSKGARDE